jgi:hypothetical protein
LVEEEMGKDHLSSLVGFALDFSKTVPKSVNIEEVSNKLSKVF